MRFLHILFFLVGVQLMINGAFFSSSLLTALGTGCVCLFLLLATKRPHGNNGHHGTDIGPNYHQVGTPHSKETYFAPLALIALIGGALSYLFLPISDLYQRTAVTLAGTGLIYLLLATFAHGWRLTRKNVLGILFSLLFLLGLGAIIALRRQPIKTYSEGVLSRITNYRVETPNTNFSSGDTSGADSTMSGTMPTTDTGMATVDTGIVSSGISTPLPSALENLNSALTYAQLIPYIVHKYHLTATGKDVAFTYIPMTDVNYEAFKAAYYTRFFSKAVNPGKLVSCDNYAVFVGLADNRSISYTASNVYTAFRNEAARRGVLHGCTQGAYVKGTNLN